MTVLARELAHWMRSKVLKLPVAYECELVTLHTLSPCDRGKVYAVYALQTAYYQAPC